MQNYIKLFEEFHKINESKQDLKELTKLIYDIEIYNHQTKILPANRINDVLDNLESRKPDIDAAVKLVNDYIAKDKGKSIATSSAYKILSKFESYSSEYSFITNEAKKIIYKRKYTENHPAKEVGLHGKVRDKVLDAMSDNILTQEEFDNIIKEFNLSQRWVRNNSHLFKVKGGNVVLSETGHRIFKAKTKVLSENN